ncbi:MAG: oxidoreductase [Rhodobacter sp.]|nr:oxidoreductase [Rhodobacter sp.]
MLSVSNRENRLVTQLTLTVIAVRQAAERVREIVLAAADGGVLPAFAAGAHIAVSLPGRAETREYSLIDFDGPKAAPRAYCLGVLLDPESRGGSRYMHDLATGDTVLASAPRNDFALHEGPEPALLIAGGIGVTPLITMAGHLKSAGRPYALLYAGRTDRAMAFADRLADTHGPALRLHHDDQAGGPLDLHAALTDAGPGTHLYVCGPRPMIEAAREIAAAAGLPHARVHFELFEAAAPQAGDQPFEVELASTGQIFTIPPGRSIIAVLEEAGVDLMYDCQRGDCGICQTAVLEGVPDHRDVVLTDAERAAGKLMHICVSRAKSPRLKLDL